MFFTPENLAELNGKNRVREHCSLTPILLKKYVETKLVQLDSDDLELQKKRGRSN